MSSRKVTMKGKPYELGGTELKVGMKAPDFELQGIDMKPKKLSDFSGKVLIISTVLSIDTSVCDAETRRFNEQAASLGNGVAVLTVSVDLPMAQRRWCGATGIDRVTMLSDHMSVSFGKDYGVLIPSLRSLARCVFVVDKSGVVRYIQLVDEISTEPDYDPIIAAAKKLL